MGAGFSSELDVGSTQNEFRLTKGNEVIVSVPYDRASKNSYGFGDSPDEEDADFFMWLHNGLGGKQDKSAS